MGLNIGSFDMQFVKKWLPVVSAMLGYRSIDLNALLFVEAIRREQGFDSLKKKAKEVGIEVANLYVPERKAHDALWDAYSNIGMLQFINERGSQ